MAVTWKIRNTDYTVKGAKGTNQIHTLHWDCSDAETVDGVTHSGRMYGYRVQTHLAHSLNKKSDSLSNCITWAKALLGSDEVTRIETSVDNQITVSKTPKTG